jgi:2-polyprenyl-3-methyl-5-hydroxy-6-metoxy-1,4-benzoquinol methylase
LDVLEIGYGGGLTLLRLARAGHRVSGVERHLLRAGESPEAPRRIPHDLRGATLYDASAEEAPLPPCAFDLVIAVHVVEHLTEPARVFRKIAESLRPGGRLYCMTPNAQSLGLRLFGRHWWNLEDPTHYRFFSPRSLTMMLRDAGFESVQTRVAIEDSLTLEANSVVRMVTRGDAAHGVLHAPFAALASVALTPLTLLGRLCVPALSPSFETVAIR